MKKQEKFEGIIYYPNPTKDHSYYYIPPSPAPQMDTNSEPMISITGAGTQWFFQASTKWKVASELLDLLVKSLMEQGLIQSKKDLTLAPLKVQKAELILNIQGNEQILASSKSSGHYPFTAMFNTSISENLQKEVVAAFHGKKDVLLISYHATVDIEYLIKMTLAGPIHLVNNKLDEDSSLSDIAIWLEEQIHIGSIIITQQYDEDAPEQLISQSNKKLMDEAIDQIHRHLKHSEITSNVSSLKIEVNESLSVSEEFITTTDISSWFKNNPNDHIKIIA